MSLLSLVEMNQCVHERIGDKKTLSHHLRGDKKFSSLLMYPCPIPVIHVSILPRPILKNHVNLYENYS
jgi:hypothetical protein